jgi:hypothetical protein
MTRRQRLVAASTVVLLSAAAFVVELPAGSLSRTAVTRLVHAVSMAATASICGELQTCR